MIREPYVGMPIIIGGNPGHIPDPPGTSRHTERGGMHGLHQQNTASPGETQWMQGTDFDARLLGSLPIAMTYTPMQKWKTTYAPAEALMRGTVFPELDLPFEGRRLL